MASCPKCGKTGIAKSKGVRECRRCGPLDRVPEQQSVRIEAAHIPHYFTPSPE